MRDVLLSVCIRAFNQEKYISQAIESVLSQRTQYAFEILVSDDNSSDDTAKILNSYAEKHPEIIKVFYQKDNLGGPKNLQFLVESSKSKYLAFCDGDDFWIDDYKLQKQIDFLESHSEYAGCFHNVIKCYESIDNKPSLFLPLNYRETCNLSDFISDKWFCPINSEVIVRKYTYFPEWYQNVRNDDYVMNLMATRNGDFYYMRDIMAVYRLNKNSSNIDYQNNPITMYRNLQYIFHNLENETGTEYKQLIDNRISEVESLIVKHERMQRHCYLKYFDWRYFKRQLFKKLRIQRIVDE